MKERKKEIKGKKKKKRHREGKILRMNHSCEYLSAERCRNCTAIGATLDSPLASRLQYHSKGRQ